MKNFKLTKMKKKLLAFTIAAAFLKLLFIPQFASGQSQYPDSVIAYSTQYSPACNAASRALGAPDVIGCGDNCNAWTSAFTGYREFLELGFATPQPVTTIKIYETYNSDPVDTVYLRNQSTQQWIQVFSQTAFIDTTCPKILTINIPTTSYNVDAIRLAINDSIFSNSPEIDAVQISTLPFGPLTLMGIGANQTNSVVFVNDLNVNILRLDLLVEGALGSLTLNSLSVTSANTNDTDIANLKLWTGTDTTHFQQIGNTQTFSSHSATFSGLTDSLIYGDNDLWITYNIASNIQGLPHIADAKINAGAISIIASGGATNPGIQPPTPLNPPEYKTIFSANKTFPLDNYQRLYFFLRDTTPNGSLAFIDNYLTPSPGITTVCPLQSFDHNSLAANPLDGYLYYNDEVWGIYRVDADCNMTPVCPFDGNSDVGTFDSQGRYWTFDQSSTTLLAIDITTCSIVKSYSFTPATFNDFIDIAYNSKDGYIYTEFGRFDTLGNLDLSYSNTKFVPNQNYGGVAIGSDNNLYGIGDDGKLSVINLTTDSSYLVYDFYPAAVTDGRADAASFPPSRVLPVANFQSSDSTFCTSQCINYTDLSTNATAWQWSFPGGTPSSSTIQNPQGICYDSAGTFNTTLIASNSVGSDTLTFTNHIKVFATPPTPVITQHHDTLFCTTDPTYTSYQWYDSTILIPGATDTLIIVTHGGNYNVAVTNEFGCKISVGITIAHNVGINEFSTNNYISISPNPATDELLVNGKWKSETGKAKLAIFNIIGEIIYTEEINRKQETINCKPFPAGIYFVQVANENGRWVGRFVKE